MQNIEKFSTRLIARRTRLNMSQADLAHKAGVSPSSITAWERAINMPTTTKMEKLSKALGVNSAWLMGEEMPEQPIPTPKHHGGPYWGTTNRVPIISWASAGHTNSYEDLGHNVETIPTCCKDANCYALRVEGDSMVPRFYQGDIVVAMPNVHPQTGDVVIAKTKEDAIYLKIYFRHGKQQELVTLKSYNDFYPPMEFHADQLWFAHPIHSCIRILKGGI